jgi:hypothetical protein
MVAMPNNSTKIVSSSFALLTLVTVQFSDTAQLAVNETSFVLYLPLIFSPPRTSGVDPVSLPTRHAGGCFR